MWVYFKYTTPKGRTYESEFTVNCDRLRRRLTDDPDGGLRYLKEDSMPKGVKVEAYAVGHGDSLPPRTSRLQPRPSS